MAPRFDKQRVDELLKRVADELGGEWLLIGGGLVATWLDARRTTEDLDLIGLEGTADERLRLMELAERAGLPIEAVNSAADFFVRRVPDWRAQLVPLLRGARGTLYRPSITLFIQLKASRLSGTDLSDCVAALDHARKHASELDLPRLRAALEALPPTQDRHLKKRRGELQAALEACGR